MRRLAIHVGREIRGVARHVQVFAKRVGEGTSLNHRSYLLRTPVRVAVLLGLVESCGPRWMRTGVCRQKGQSDPLGRCYATATEALAGARHYATASVQHRVFSKELEYGYSV